VFLFITCVKHTAYCSLVRNARGPHERFVQQYGRTLRVFGMAKVIYYRQQELLIKFTSLYVQFDQRILTLDPTAIGHVLNRPALYQKPWQSRAFISAIISESLLSAEGGKHRRQRRVADQAFSERNLQTFLPIMFSKSSELTKKWISIVENSDEMMTVIDVANWIHRLTLVGLAVLFTLHIAMLSSH
jgi:cytochrome P450